MAVFQRRRVSGGQARVPSSTLSLPSDSGGMGLDDAEDDADEDDEEEELVEDSPAAAKFKEMLDSMRERSLNKLFVAVRAFI